MIIKMIKNKKILLALIIILALVGVGIFWYVKYGNPKYDANTTSKANSAQNNYKGDSRHTRDSQSDDTQQGGAIDNKGDMNNDASDGISSKSGLVTVLGPTSNQQFESGSILRGRATGVSKVQYRVVDDNVGVIAQGSLGVVNGGFSGTMQFSSGGSTGRVEVFTYSQNYNEENTVQIPVRFKD